MNIYSDDYYAECRLCPRNCGADRLSGAAGFCGAGSEPVVAAAVLHKGEEPPLTAGGGSGTIFFSGCTLGCGFCQNIQISGRRPVLGAVPEGGTDGLAEIMLRLQLAGAANVNLVTASQFAPSVVSAVARARASGLTVPVVWNSSGYETVETVRMLSDTVDIWLPDLKTADPGVSADLFGISGYPEAAAGAILEMRDSVGRKGGGLLGPDGEMRRGIILRHLVMPGYLESSRGVIQWFAENLKDDALFSLMVQYVPVTEGGDRFASEGYLMSDDDYDQLVDWLEAAGIEEGFLQDPEAADSAWRPDFNRRNPFPGDYSSPVWHWKYGFSEGRS